MAYQQKPGDIAVFREKQKKSEKAPDWRGSLIVPDGVGPGDKLDVAFWQKTDTMLAGNVQVPRDQGQSSGGYPAKREDATDSFRQGGYGSVARNSRDGAGSPPFDDSDTIPF